MRELLVAPGSDNLWLIQPLREKVLCTIKEALLLSSTAFLVFFFYGSLSQSLGSLRRRRVCFSTSLFGAQHIGLSQKNPIAIGGCLSLHWQVWSDEGAEPWVVEVLRWGIPDFLPLGSHLIQGSHPFTGVCLQFHQGQSSGGRGSGSADQGCLRAGSASISRLLQPIIHGYESFRVVETGHRPFHSELEDSADILQDGDTSIRSSLGSSGGLDGVSGLEGCVLAGANAPEFTQVPQVHSGGEGVPVQGTLLRLFHGSASFYQGMAPVSAILHRMGVRLRRYLDAWLLQASSHEQVLFVLRAVLQLCRRLVIVVNWEKSQVIPTQQMVYLGVILDSLLSVSS